MCPHGDIVHAVIVLDEDPRTAAITRPRYHEALILYHTTSRALDVHMPTSGGMIGPGVRMLSVLRTSRKEHGS